MAKSDAPSGMERWLVRKETPIRLTALAFVLGLTAIVIWDLYIKVMTGGTVATFYRGVIADLPFLIISAVILYYVLSRYSTAVEKAQAKTCYQASLVDNVADAIIAMDQNLAIISWNKGAEKMYGWTAEEALGKNVIDFLKTRFYSSTLDDTLARLSKEGSVRGEVSQVCKDGRTIDVKGSTSLVDVEGRHVSYVNIGIDVTEARRAEEALKESEETFRSLFENSPIALFEIDVSRSMAKFASLSPSAVESVFGNAEGRREILRELISHLDVKAVNRRSLELFEASGKGELLSHLGDVLTDDTAMKLAEGMAEMMAGSVHFVGETKAKTLKGKEIYVSVDWSPAVSSEGAPTRFVVAFNDLTRIKKAEDELRAVASLPEENPSPVLRLASDGTISYSNPAGRAILQAWDCKVGGMAPQVWRETVREVLADKGSRIMEMEYGGVFYSISVAPVQEGGYVNLYASDITERERMTSALRESSERFRAAFESASLGAVITSLDGRWLRVNQALADMLGYPAVELVGKPFFEFLVAEDREMTMKQRERLLAGNFGTYSIEQRYIRRDGMIIWVSSNTSMVHGPSGESLYTVSLIADITGKKLAEEQLHIYSTRLEELVEARTAELEETHRVLLESEGLAAIGRVSTQLAHDLRNPLAGIRTESFVLHELISKPHDPRVKDTLRLLSGSVDHAGKIIEDLLEYTRTQEPVKRPIELGACVADAAAAYLIPKGVELVIRKVPRVYVMAEQDQLVKLVRSLFDNAVTAMPGGGKLTISFEPKEGFVSFSVADTGSGIDKADLPKLFLPFYSTKAKGLGLGLPIARKIAEAHGGTIEVRSRKGRGTIVTVTLPAA